MVNGRFWSGCHCQNFKNAEPIDVKSGADDNVDDITPMPMPKFIIIAAGEEVPANG